MPIFPPASVRARNGCCASTTPASGRGDEPVIANIVALAEALRAAGIDTDLDAARAAIAARYDDRGLIGLPGQRTWSSRRLHSRRSNSAS